MIPIEGVTDLMGAIAEVLEEIRKKKIRSPKKQANWLG